MRTLLAMVWAVAMLAASLCHAADLYVSLAGNDQWSGRLPDPTADGRDGPLQTLERARDQARAIRAAAPAPVPVTIHLRAGRYELTAPLVLGPEDSGGPDAAVVYRSFGDERAVLSGGRRLTGWRVDPRGRWTLDLPEVAAGRWSFSQLFVDGRRAPRPRVPRDSYALIAAQVAPSPANAEKGWDRFRYAPGDIRADWRNLGDLEVLALHTWSMSRLRVAAVDEQQRVVSFTGPSPNIADWAALHQGDRYIVENVAEALDEPGEWYMDRPSGLLMYVPLPGQTPQTTEVIAPVAESLVVLKGDAEGGRFVEHVEFRGISFEHTNWVSPPQGYACAQAEMAMPAAIRLEAARHSTFEDCSVRQVGGYAFELGTASSHNRVERCDLSDLGAGGIKIGDSSIRDDPRYSVTHNTVRDCLIAHGGRTHPAAVGVLITHAAHNTIEHNEIADLYYTGVSVGWSWGYAPTVTHHNTIASNHIHDLGQGVLSDMGGIYTLGVSPGTVIRGNRIHNIRRHAYGGWGIYFDEGSSGIVAADNVVYATASAPFHQHYGRDNVVENSILALGGEAQIMRTRPEEHLSFTIERCIIYWTDPQVPLLSGAYGGGGGERFRFDRNTYWHGGEPIDFAGKTREEWRAAGQDAHSLIADPLLTDPAAGDFAVPGESPAVKAGFRPFDQSKAGLLTRRGAPVVPDTPAFPLKSPRPPPMGIDDGFEDTPPGSPAIAATTSEEPAGGTIRVSEERAAAGRRSLKFTDVAGQQDAYNPHLFYRPRHEAGTVHASFRLWRGASSALTHEWRTWPAGQSYRAGPSVSVAADGTVTASGREVGRVPEGQWVEVRIVAPLGEQAGRYSLAITDQQGRKLVDDAALLVSAGFATLDWFGFTSDAAGVASFYIDDLVLEAR